MVNASTWIVERCDTVANQRALFNFPMDDKRGHKHHLVANEPMGFRRSLPKCLMTICRQAVALIRFVSEESSERAHQLAFSEEKSGATPVI